MIFGEIFSYEFLSLFKNSKIFNGQQEITEGKGFTEINNDSLEEDN